MNSASHFHNNNVANPLFSNLPLISIPTLLASLYGCNKNTSINYIGSYLMPSMFQTLLETIQGTMSQVHRAKDMTYSVMHHPQDGACPSWRLQPC